MAGTMYIALNPGGSGEYNLQGGTLTAGGIYNAGTFNFSGGTLNAPLANMAQTNLTGYGTRTLGAVTNEGTFTVTSTTVNFTGSQVNNITGNGFNIYYDPSEPDNAYLGGMTYALVAGGQLMPVAADPPGCHTGDANGDGNMGLADLLALADNYGVHTGATWTRGDFNGDGQVGLADLLALADNYGWNGDPCNPTSVPEPAALALLAIGGLVLTRRGGTSGRK